MSSSEIEDIKISDDYTDLTVIGYRAKEIAKNIDVGQFNERNEVSIQDFLEYSRKIIIPETYATTIKTLSDAVLKIFNKDNYVN